MIRHLPVVLVLLLAACSGPSAGPPPAPPPGAAPAARAENETAPAGLNVPPALQQKWGVATAPVERLTVSGALRLPGVLGLNQQRTAHISAALEGKVVSIAVDLGDAVAKDQVLLVLHSPPFAAAQSGFLQAHSKRNVARRELERARELLKEEAIEQREYQRRQAEFEAASTDYGLAESTLHSLGWDHPRIDAMLAGTSKVGGDLSHIVEPYLRVRSPIAGRVISRSVVVGEHVPPDKLLFQVSDLSTLWAQLDARESDLPALASARRVAIESAVYPARAFEGRIARIGDVVDEKLRTVSVRAEVPNPGLLLKPNMYVQGVVQTNGEARKVLAVPEEAIQTIDGEPSVFVASGDGNFAPRPVQVGELVGRARTITRGLDGTERVVVAGAFNLKAELLKGSFAGE
jgi:cobalt-zinc-cadmium efflux system membrane fusion protein